MKWFGIVLLLGLFGCGQKDTIESKRNGGNEITGDTPAGLDLVCSSSNSGDSLVCSNGSTIAFPSDLPYSKDCNQCKTHVKDGVASVNCPNGLQFSFPLVKGDKGDKGDKGEKGTTGNTGSTGQTGATGANGKDGKDGANCTVAKNSINQTVITCGNTSQVISSSCGYGGCWSFGASGNVYTIPSTTTALPNLDTMTPQETVKVDQFDVFNRDWALGYPGLPTRLEWYAIRYTGYILLTGNASNSYKLRLTSDDGAKLYIDGSLTVNNDGLHAPNAVTGTVLAQEGWHYFKLDYFQGPRTQIALALEVSVDNGATWALVDNESLKFESP